MTISNEAVEAAARALYFYLDEDHRGAPEPWESLAEDDDAKIDAKAAARIALEAAAPHILAGATFPYESGDITVIGPECFTDGETICYMGVNYRTAK